MLQELLNLTEKVAFEVIERHGAIAITYSSRLKILNLFNRKVLFEKDLKDTVCDIKYVEALNYLSSAQSFWEI